MNALVLTKNPFITLPNNSEGLLTLKLAVCAASHTHLVEEWTVRYGNTQRGEAPANHHVIRSVIAVAAAAAGQEPGYGRFAEHYPANIQIVSKKTNQESKHLLVTPSPQRHSWVSLTLRLLWCSCIHCGAGHSRIAPPGSLLPSGRSNAAACATWPGLTQRTQVSS